MTKKHRTFTPEFKAEAADLMLEHDYSYAEACGSLDIGETGIALDCALCFIAEHALSPKKMTNNSDFIMAITFLV
ncbi:transposase [Teredinibacter haidensis]|uniref:transposase n=1 Tax=Teredinibacter haidensis TaxID=2731755 RepID=UPI0009488CAE|nr:transposase [Teredinibacter haidensis]